MKKVIIEINQRIICPHCKENRSMMMLISKGKYTAFHCDYAKPGDTILCVSCNKKFER